MRHHQAIAVVACLLGAVSPAGRAFAEASPVTITAVKVTPAALQPGQSVTFSASVVAHQKMTNYPVEFSWGPVGVTTTTNAVVFASFEANVAQTKVYQWTIAPNAAPGAYQLTASVFNPSWTSLLASVHQAFAITASTPQVSQGTAPGRGSAVSTTGVGTSPPRTTAATSSVVRISAGTSAGAAIQNPGPSQQLFANPYYVCSKNYYVSNTGNDANNGTSQSTAWATLQHANNAIGSRSAPGTCINVGPGAYEQTVLLSAGGSSASAGGYLVYRCLTLDSCKIVQPAGTYGVFQAGLNRSGTYPNYLIFDGFFLVGNGISSPYSVGVACYNGNTSTQASGCHHWMILNNIITNFAQAGINNGDTEYWISSHNTIVKNAQQCNGIYGSGLSYVTPKVVAGYSLTGDDLNSSNNPSLNLVGVQGPSFPFHNLVAWNVVYNNYNTCLDGSDSDGNGIIMDTFGTQNGNTVSYTQPTLVAFNVVFNNGGGGVHIFASENVTAANNTCYNNGLDPLGSRVTTACIDTNQSYSNTILNNIAVAIPAAPLGGVCAFYQVPYQQFSNAILGGVLASSPADTFSNNITQLQGGNNSCWGVFGNDAPTGETPMFNADSYSCSANQCATNPLWVSAGTSSVGTESTIPNGSNFALMPNSPAIGSGLKQPYLPAQSVDVGACHHSLGTCP